MTEFLEDRKRWVSGFTPQPFRRASWSDFPAGDADRLGVLQAVQEYRNDVLDGSRRSLLLYGPPGSGKTMLASLVWKDIAPHVQDRQAVDDAIAAGTADNVVWATGTDIPEIIKHGSDRQPGFNVTTAHLETAFFGVLDDIDKCPAGWGGSLLEILNARLWGKRLPTILTMNTTPREFVAKYREHGLPIWSRVERSGGVVIKVESENEETVGTCPAKTENER